MAGDLVALTQTIKAASVRQGGVRQSGGYGTVPPPYISPGPSPLVASYDEWTAGHASGTSGALPRDWATFLSGAFGPLAPIKPVPIDTPLDGMERPPPRRFQYPIGWDMPMGMPGTEGLGKLADFQTLRTLADLYSVARACIDLRKSELRGIGWNIALTKEAAKSLRGNRKGMADFAARRSQAIKFFRQPDPRYGDFSSWFDALLEEVFVTDALTLYLHPSRRPGKGLLGSNIAALDLLDGTLIKPLVDILGGVPAPPNPAFQQFEYGVPRADFMALMVEEEASGEMIAEYRGDQLLYLPYTARTWTPYGQAPIERAIIPVMAGLNRQQYQLNFFQEGSIPGLFVSPGDTNMTPQQIRELQDALNALAGDQAWKHKIIVLPGGSRVDPQKPTALADQFDEIIMTQVCMAFQVMPMELGISPRISATQSVGVANQMAKASQDIQERKGTVPLLMWLKASVFDRLIQDVCGQEDMEFQWEGLEEDEDVETLTSLLSQQIEVGLTSIDEARIELGRDPWNMPITSDPGWATPRTGFIPLTSIPMEPIIRAPSEGGQQYQALPPGSGGQQKPANGPASQEVDADPLAGGAPSVNGGTSRPASTGRTGQVHPHGTPAHTAARAGVRSTQSALPAAAHSRRKAAVRELDLLRNHLRKGGQVGEWQARDVPGHILAVVTEDLTKGIPMEDVIYGAKTLLGNADLVKDAADLTDPSPVEAEHVINQMRRNYPDKALGWMHGAIWTGPVLIPLDRIDFDDADKWAASHQPERVAEFARQIKHGEAHLHPVVAVQIPGNDKIRIIDGHHRTLAYRHLGQPVKAYVGRVSSRKGQWDETHSYQFHQGDDPANKTGKISHLSVDYRPAGSETRRCGTCVMFRAPSSCTLVQDPIYPDGVCDRWEPKPASKTAGGGPGPKAHGRRGAVTVS